MVVVGIGDGCKELKNFLEGSKVSKKYDELLCMVATKLDYSRIDRQMDGQMDGHRQTDRQTDRHADRQADRLTDGQTDRLLAQQVSRPQGGRR